ncbi:hypothetical protein B0H14DRAFT_2626946 [Mycena olivaceomarginata]|nr:hypothetical protein B0H14DRAFT_2626946 [Mycena olivaceomarginata]
MHLAALILTPIFLAAGIASGFTLNTRNALEPPEPLCGGIGTKCFLGNPAICDFGHCCCGSPAASPTGCDETPCSIFQEENLQSGEIVEGVVVYLVTSSDMQVRQLMGDRRRLMEDRRYLMAQARQIRTKRRKGRRMWSCAPKKMQVRHIFVQILVLSHHHLVPPPASRDFFGGPYWTKALNVLPKS